MPRGSYDRGSACRARRGGPSRVRRSAGPSRSFAPRPGGSMQERQPWLLALAAVLALAAAIVLPSAEARTKRLTRVAALTKRVERQRDTVWRWQRLMRE